MTQVVVCGAGIAGISSAFHMVRAGLENILIVDPRAPLSVTSDKSTECYRDWWPSEPMVRLMSRSIELLDRYARESDNVFALNRRGYLYLTAEPDRLDQIMHQGETIAAMGVGDLRVHHRPSSAYVPSAEDGFEDAPAGADLVVGAQTVQHYFPYVSEHTVGALHARTAGWLSAQQLGTWMLEEILAAGGELIRDEVIEVVTVADRVVGVTLADTGELQANVFVNAAGPLLANVGRLVGVDLPVFSEVHKKTAFRDHRTVIPRSAPMLIWNDQQQLPWSDDEVAALLEADRSDVLGSLPAGCHARPEGGPASTWVLGLWEYNTPVIEPKWPIPTDPLYTEVVLAGLSSMVPALAAYKERLPEAFVDGGYYTKTIENRPLIGPVGPEGSFVCGALSGFGIMAACAAGELVAGAAAGYELPDWARWFDLRRYDDPGYIHQMDSMGDSGQL